MNNKKINASKFRIPKTLSESIYEHLKESILNKELEPHQRINEQAIADSFEVSRTPVREAVVRLAAEGFVDIVSHREALVKEVSYKELKEVFQVIGVLDRLAAYLIVDKIDSHELTKLEKLTSKMERHFIMREVEKFLDLNYAIHERLWDYLTDKNMFLQKELRFCVNQLKMCYYPLNRAFEDPKIMRKSMIAHKEIMEAIKEKNTAKLETIIFDHWTPPLP
ncbi:MAG: GntR family transcriptional regulator [Candidatus Aminicenantes bacterium]|nr:GntR family transcriptional regulator [Candidatus Aminicenantes bacterium]